uniref:Putative nucleotidyltransferase n=1 Tax=viral metagenome TaxID=1070528 RepID=A0A6M3IGD9_9ZZZZ
MKTILKVLVGSRAHGLNDENSDYDYRAVYVSPTSEILSLGHKYKGTDWYEGKEDNTSYEIGHFLCLATKCNPSILEVLRAETITEMDSYGESLRGLFPHIWNPQDAFNAFTGYSHNQRKKMLDKKDNRQNKYAVAYVRTLINLISLLKTGTFSLMVPEMYYKNIKDIRNGKWSFGHILDWAEEFKKNAEKRLENCTHKPNPEKVNDFLLKVRKENW